MTATVNGEKTFSSYNQSQSQAYAQTRIGYHPNVYKAVLDYHVSNGGQLNHVLDVGCGTGLATEGLASYFEHITGIDPSSGMIAVAKSLDLKSKLQPVRFDISTAESLGADLEPAIVDSSIDLIASANAAHCFDMPRFWARAAQVLKPGGTVALWTSGDIRVHPSTPNAPKVQAAIDAFDDKHMRPHYLPGNLLKRDGYRGLPMSWTVEPTVADFEEKSFVRREWDVDEDFFVGIPEGGMDVFERSMSSQSAYVRWKEANLEIAGTDDDPLKLLRRQIEVVLQEAGVEPGQEVVKGAVSGVILLVKKAG